MEAITAIDTPALLKDEASYENEVNRKVIMKNASGAINLIALKRGQKLKEHLAPADAMVQVIEGRMNFIIKGNHYVLEAGNYLLMQKDDPHSLEAVEDTKFLLTLLK